MIIDGFEFVVHRNNESRSSWMCIGHNKYKCKVRLLTTGRVLKMKNIAHNHGRTFTGDYRNLKGQMVQVVVCDVNNKLDKKLFN
ncbi:unnamed protein product [Ceutorhynchus assimilis]|uniref:FLYWCH-type domain-containing protein n=1 Tax=Ceutorhynchus assimilis TaxID=467358 RepID=A0A9N9MGG6_9CUCU|nr:unnamed protein product [Ceutorhynchus assimilis]